MIRVIVSIFYILKAIYDILSGEQLIFNQNKSTKTDLYSPSLSISLTWLNGSSQHWTLSKYPAVSVSFSEAKLLLISNQVLNPTQILYEYKFHLREFKRNEDHISIAILIIQ